MAYFSPFMSKARRVKTGHFTRRNRLGPLKRRNITHDSHLAGGYTTEAETMINFFHVFYDLAINLLQEFIGLSQYLFDAFVFESSYDIAFLLDYHSHFLEYTDQRLNCHCLPLFTNGRSEIHLHLKSAPTQSGSFSSICR
jgi:hypothetical protein